MILKILHLTTLATCATRENLGTEDASNYFSELKIILAITRKKLYSICLMNPTQILSIVQSQSGRHVSVNFKSEAKPAAAFKSVKLEKYTKGAYRVGISFENLKGVREGIENGERETPQAPNGKRWVQYPFHLTNIAETTDYLRLYFPTGGAIQVPSVTYLVNGEEVSKDRYNSFLTPSAAAPKERDSNMDCFDIKMENVISIG
jgi:hypothetical protein